MTRERWLEHVMTVTGLDWLTANLDEKHNALTKHYADCPDCADCAARRKTRKANRYARERHAAYASCGLVRVKGSLGGTYYE